MLQTLPQRVQLSGRLATVAPNHLPGLPKPLLVIGESDEVVEGRHGAFWREVDPVFQNGGRGASQGSWRL